MTPLLGIHTNWTAPWKHGRAREQNAASAEGEYSLPDHEILGVVLSILSWKKFHGRICLQTDERGRRYAETIGILNLYDEVDVAAMSRVDPRIDPATFWAGGKFSVFASLTPPFAHIDSDLFLLEPLDLSRSPDVIYAHAETDALLYGNQSGLALRPEITEADWDWSRPAYNVAITYFKNSRSRDSYVEKFLSYMASGHPPPVDAIERLSRMVFEQALLSLEVGRLGLTAEPVVSSVWAGDSQTWRGEPADGHRYIHTWQRKMVFVLDPEYRAQYCRYLVGLILEQAPSLEGLLKAIGSVRPHFEAVARGARPGPEVLRFWPGAHGHPIEEPPRGIPRPPPRKNAPAR